MKPRCRIGRKHNSLLTTECWDITAACSVAKLSTSQTAATVTKTKYGAAKLG